MSVDRFVVLGLASARSPWFRIVTGWAMSGALPLEFVKCVSVEELRARLGSGRTHSAVLVDGDTPGFDRDVLAAIDEAGCATAVVTPPTQQRDWVSLGAACELAPDFTRNDLLEALTTHAQPVEIGIATGARQPPGQPDTSEGRLLCVTGRGGTGTSTVAIALAQALAADPRSGGRVLLADLALRADQAMLHDAHDIVPGVQELVEAHRASRPSIEQIRQHAFTVESRGYDLLLGLRRARDWVGLRPRSFESTLASLRRSYHAVVADCEGDLEGEDDGGSIDVEERNVAARRSIAECDQVFVVGTPTLAGVHGLVHVVDDVLRHGVDPQRVQTVVNRAPRSARQRAELTRTIAELVDADRPALSSPVFLPERRHLDDVHRNATPMPAGFVAPLGGAVRSPAEPSGASTPVQIVPGTLSSWAHGET